jgi:hypothetical protein
MENQRYGSTGLSELADQLDQIYWTRPGSQPNFSNQPDNEYRQADSMGMCYIAIENFLLHGSVLKNDPGSHRDQSAIFCFPVASCPT